MALMQCPFIILFTSSHGTHRYPEEVESLVGLVLALGQFEERLW